MMRKSHERVRLKKLGVTALNYPVISHCMGTLKRYMMRIPLKTCGMA